MALGLLAGIGGAIAVQGLIQGLLYTYPPWISGRARQTYAGNPNVLPSIDSLVSMAYRDVIPEQEYTRRAKELGFSEGISREILKTSRRMLDGESYVRLWRRGHLDETSLDADLKAIHFTENEIAKIKQVTEYFPQPQDLVRFAVREVYDDQIRSKFGMDQDISGKFLAEAAKAGLQPEQAQNYWAAHWDLPSVQQVFEMYHRDVIEKPEMDMALKALDIMPFWRDALTKIAYRPLTRVDIRRMHNLGILSPEEVAERYRHIGFSPEDAEIMKDFTLRYNSDDTTGITRGSIIKAFKDGLLSQADLRDMLVKLGYAEDVINFWITIAAFEKAQEDIDDNKARLFEQYRVGAITESQLRTGLGYHGVPATYVDTQLGKAKIEAAKKTKMPTRTDLTDWLVKGIIDEPEFHRRMKEIGYQQADVIRYLTELALEIEDVDFRKLGIATYTKWLKAGIIQPDIFREISYEMGYSPEDTNVMIQLAWEEP